MDKAGIQIRMATPEDAAALQAIYAPYVRETAISFEYDVPTVEEFAGRIRHTLQKYPYIVAEKDGEALGYAYAGPFSDRPAYDWSVETSIYVSREKRGMGVGRLLHTAMEEMLRQRVFLSMYACIACPAVEDEYLTRDSQHFHAHMGYRLVGEFEKCGCKFGRWYNIVWMEKHIGAHGNAPQPPQM